MKNFITSLFDFFLPRFCPSCKSKLSSEETAVCSLCFSRIKFADDDRINFEYKKKFEGRNIISGFTSIYIFEKDRELQHIIHSIKYNKRFLNSVCLGKTLAPYLEEKMNTWNIDLLIPVPLHRLKKAERGYNQSYYIAKGLSKELSIKVDESALKRKKYTQSQTTMNWSERQENIKDAFLVQRHRKIKNKNILLLDDVITTGATVAECGRVLLQAGANKIYAASIAIAD